MSLVKLLAGRGILLSKISSRREIRDAWSRLQPRLTEHELVRIGTCDGDGGYLLPHLDGFDGLFSAGIAGNVDFEIQASETWDIPVWMIDASIERLPQDSKYFIFQRLFLGATSASNYITLPEWVSASNSAGENLILKVDIEGFEYESVTCQSADILKKFKVMIFEMHSLEQIATVFGLRAIQLFIDRITANHTIVHAHANNVGGIWKIAGVEIPAGLEITLLRNDAFVEDRGPSVLPHPLDRDCVPTQRSITARW